MDSPQSKSQVPPVGPRSSYLCPDFFWAFFFSPSDLRCSLVRSRSSTMRLLRQFNRRAVQDTPRVIPGVHDAVPMKTTSMSDCVTLSIMG